jgi:hypothetical protein
MHDIESKGAVNYLNLAREILTKNEKVFKNNKEGKQEA